MNTRINNWIDAAYLRFVLGPYLNLLDKMPVDDWFLEPPEDRQTWKFRDMIVDKPKEENGEEQFYSCFRLS